MAKRESVIGARNYNPNDTKDVLEVKTIRRRAARRQAAKARTLYAAIIAMNWENGDEDAFDAPAP